MSHCTARSYLLAPLQEALRHLLADSATLKPCTDFLQLAEACAVVPGERGPLSHGSCHHRSVLQDPPRGRPADAPICHLVGVSCVCVLYPALAGVTTFRRHQMCYCILSWLCHASLVCRLSAGWRLPTFSTLRCGARTRTPMTWSRPGTRSR